MRQFPPNDPIHSIIQGVRKFQSEIYPQKQALFEALAKKQEPKVLFVTCSDSRVDPSLITQTDPGSLFLVQNAGNIIPPHGTPYGGTGASIEYAVTVLGIEHIIVCGHSSCGAMAALLDDATLTSAPPIINQWVSYAETTRAIVDMESNGLDKADKLHRAIARNVQVQISHLKTFPSVAAKLAVKQLTVHGWFYQIESGKIDVYDPASEGFVSFDQAYAGL